MIEQGLYVGDVMHRRLRPRRHAFRYRAFWLVLDLDSLQQTARKLRFLSLGRFNLFGFFERDHADGEAGPLAAKIRGLVARENVVADGPIRLLTMPRVLGHVFNPLSLYFCYDAGEKLVALVWEVSNTFGERHSYVIGVDDPDAATIRQHAKKLLHVSPFIGMDIDYVFRVTRGDDALTVGIVDRDSEGVLLTAALTARRKDLTDRALFGVFLRIPVATLKIVGAIHWEALRLWLKGARFRRTPVGHNRPIAAHSVSSGADQTSETPRLIA